MGERSVFAILRPLFPLKMAENGLKLSEMGERTEFPFSRPRNRSKCGRENQKCRLAPISPVFEKMQAGKGAYCGREISFLPFYAQNPEGIAERVTVHHVNCNDDDIQLLKLFFRVLICREKMDTITP